MARQRREKSESGIYHIIWRGINRQIIFKDEEDLENFKQTLLRYKRTSGFSIFAYCLMSNHIHLLIKTGREPIEQIMRRIGSSYVKSYNNKYDRVGHLFQDRYKSEPVDDEKYLLTVTRYIHQNPMKAKICNDLSSYRWSSYLDYTNGGGITDTNFILGIFDGNRKKALENFILFSEQFNNDSCLETDEDKRRISDELLKKVFEEKFKIKPDILRKQPQDKIKAILKESLNIEGVSTRQLSKVTGISKNIIWKLK